MTETDYDIVARTLYGEARGEYKTTGIAAFIAVANVIMNRVKRTTTPPLSPAQVCLRPLQFSCWNAGDVNRPLIQREDLEKEPLFRLSQGVAKHILEGVWPDLTQGADHYHALSVKPSWARGRKVKIRLGNHLFYKLDSTYE